MPDYAEHPDESGHGKDVRPQPARPKYMIHQLVSMTPGERGKRPTVTTGCGMEGHPPGMRDAPDSIRTSGWSRDVTCPACRRRGGVVRLGMAVADDPVLGNDG